MSELSIDKWFQYLCPPGLGAASDNFKFLANPNGLTSQEAFPYIAWKKQLNNIEQISKEIFLEILSF